MFFVAGYLQKYREEIGKNSLHVLILMLVLAVYCFLIIQQPDLGSATVIFVSCLAVLFVAGMRMKLFVILAIGSIFVFVWFIVMEPLVRKVIYVYKSMEGAFRRRISIGASFNCVRQSRLVGVRIG